MAHRLPPCARVKGPSKEQVQVLHRLYFTELREMFDARKGDVPGHEEDELVFDPPLEPLTRSEFAEAWAEATGRAEDAEKHHHKTKDGNRTEEIWVGLFHSVIFLGVVWVAYFRG